MKTTMKTVLRSTVLSAMALLALGATANATTWLDFNSTKYRQLGGVEPVAHIPYSGRELSGPNEGKMLYPCQVMYNGAWQGGKVVADGYCHFSYNVDEIALDNYQVVRVPTAWDWQWLSNRDAVVNGYLKVSTGQDDQRRYVCRVANHTGWQPGKSGRGGCEFAYNGQAYFEPDGPDVSYLFTPYVEGGGGSGGSTGGSGGSTGGGSTTPTTGSVAAIIILDNYGAACGTEQFDLDGAQYLTTDRGSLVIDESRQKCRFSTVFQGVAPGTHSLWNRSQSACKQNVTVTAGATTTITLKPQVCGP